MAYESFEVRVEEGVATVTFAQAGRGHPVDRAFCDELARIAAACSADPAVRCVLLRSTGRFFTVGGDLPSLARDRDAAAGFIMEATIGLHAAMSRLARMDAPVVVAVQGLAAGGGVSIAAGADFCLAARSATFYAAYLGIGLAVDGGASFWLPRRVGARRAAEFLMRNQTWSAEEAERHGLVTRVVDDEALDAEAHALARELAVGPTRAYGELKRLLLSSAEQPLEAQLELEAQAMARAGRTEDAWRAMQAVAAKERPVFEGR